MTKNGIRFIFLFLTVCIPISTYGFGIRYTGKYIPIDSLSQNDCQRLVSLDIKSKKIDFQIDKQTQTFVQEQLLTDSTQIFIEQKLISRSDNEYTLLTIFELLSVSEDSIYVSASHQRFNEKGNINKINKIKNLAVPKSNLSGIVVSLPTKEIKRKNKIYYWSIGTLTAVITTLSVVFGQ